MYKLNTLVGTRVSLTIKKSKQNGYTNYNVTHIGSALDCLRACLLFQAELQTGDEASICARSASPVPSSSYSTTDVTTEPSHGATTTTTTTITTTTTTTTTTSTTATTTTTTNYYYYYYYYYYFFFFFCV